MKAVVLGGAGVMGSYAANFVAKSNVFSNVVIADINVKKGEKIASQIGGDYIKVDANDEESIKNAVKGADVVINAIGPFYRYAYPILKSVINEEANYVDICDDYDITLKLIELDEEARKKGVSAIIGLGASPGITNVAASYAASQLDEVDEIKVYVTRSIKEEAGEAIPYHMLHAWIGDVPVYENGEFKMAKGLKDGIEWVNFPLFGNAAVYYFGHPETVTLPRYIKARNVACKGTFFPQSFRDFLIQLDSIGLISNEKMNIKGIEITPIDFLTKFVGKMVAKVKNENIPEGGAVMVAVKGKKNGKEMEYEFSGTAKMKEATATPAALAAIMMAKGEIERKGVIPPEAGIPSKKFLNRLVKTGIFGKTWIGIKKEIEEL